MILRDPAGMLKLVPVRRQPDGWALIEVAVEMAQGSWTAVDECLEQREVRGLARWLDEVARGRAPGEFGFIEPNLRFECLGNDGERARLRVWFEGELRPDWAPYEYWDEEDLWLELEVPLEHVAAAARDLRFELVAIER